MSLFQSGYLAEPRSVFDLDQALFGIAGHFVDAAHLGGSTRRSRQFNRWRPERDPRSCTFDQLERPVTHRLADILAGLG